MTSVLLLELQARIARGEFELSRHAEARLSERSLTIADLQEAVATGAVIEDYPAAHYFPCCLIFGITSGGRPVHVVCTYPARPLVKIITAYEPDATEWQDNYRRISKK